MLPTPRTLESALKRWLHSGNLQACDLRRVLSGGTTKLAKGFWAILFRVERTNASIPYG
jgi:hypothetical protein